ncbi:MAG: hypothetical protein PVJ40_01595 [Gammaproteobacteria bacterium]|jgi:hypothetical protein
MTGAVAGENVSPFLYLGQSDGERQTLAQLPGVITALCRICDRVKAWPREPSKGTAMVHPTLELSVGNN